MARLTVERPTPARAAMWSIVRVQRPWRRASAATTARTAVSEAVNRLARAGSRENPTGGPSAPPGEALRGSGTRSNETAGMRRLGGAASRLPGFDDGHQAIGF